MVVRDQENQPWKILDGEESHVDVVTEDSVVEARRKRSRSPTGGEPGPKRVKVDGGACLAPGVNPVARGVFQRLDKGDQQLGAGDLFLTEGFRERWCQCQSVGISRLLMIVLTLIVLQCLPALQAHPYLLKEEETYEPPEDPDSGM